MISGDPEKRRNRPLNLDPSLFTWAVNLQIFIWMIVYLQKRSWEFLETPFLVVWSLFLAYLIHLFISGTEWISTFPVPLIFYYGLQVLVSYYLFKKDGEAFPQRISLAFMLTFFSSYLWELPIHMIGILQNGVQPRFLIQSIHVLPIIFLSRFYKLKDGKRLLNYVFFGHMVTLFILFFEWTAADLNPYFPNLSGINRSLTYIIRLVNFLVVMKIFRDSEILENRISDPIPSSSK